MRYFSLKITFVLIILVSVGAYTIITRKNDTWHINNNAEQIMRKTKFIALLANYYPKKSSRDFELSARVDHMTGNVYAFVKYREPITNDHIRLIFYVDNMTEEVVPHKIIRNHHQEQVKKLYQFLHKVYAKSSTQYPTRWT